MSIKQNSSLPCHNDCMDMFCLLIQDENASQKFYVIVQ